MNWGLIKNIEITRKKPLIDVRNYGEREVNFALIYPNTYNLGISIWIYVNI